MGRRLDEVLANSGHGSRREIRQIIAAGRVCVDGQTARRTDMRIDDDSAVSVDGVNISTERYIYLAMNKPCGYVSSTEGEDSLLVIVPNEYRRKDLFPVGRLDKDTSGLIFITNDGDFSHRVTAPAKKTEKTYIAVLQSDVGQSCRQAFETGMILKDGTKTLPAKLKITGARTAEVTLCEGKYHEVRRMFACCGNKILELKRVCIGGVHLDIEEGFVRKLTETEIKLFS